MTIFLQFFRLSASFCPGAACPAVGPQSAQIPRQVGIAAPDMSGIQHPHAAPVPHTKARQHQCCPAPQVWCSHSGTMQFCAAAKVQQPSLAAGISPQGGKALRTGKAVLEQAVINAGCSLRPQQHRCSQRGSICGKARVSSRYKFLTTAQLCIPTRVMLNSFSPRATSQPLPCKKSRNAASHTGLHCVTVTRPPAMAAAAA